MNIDLQVCLDAAIHAALDAGQAILKIYKNSTYSVEWKEDNSPLTQADRASHEIITDFLRATHFPILSEEGRSVPYGERRDWNPLWIVDPLDGTKEFIKRNDEFTVNIALVENGVPICGVIFVPVTGALYFGVLNVGSFRITMTEEYSGLVAIMAGATQLPLPQERPSYIIMGSRSHGSPELETFVKQKRQKRGRVELIPAGSSIKICRVAEGSADVYPRLGPTMEWDTAAGHAIAKFAGKTLTHWGTGQELTYNKENLLNPWFVVQ